MADPQRGGQRTVRVRVIDWEHPVNDDFLLVSQFSVTGALYNLPPGFGGLRQRPAAGGHRVEEARRARAHGHLLDSPAGNEPVKLAR